MPPSKISGPNRNSRISMIERECGCGIGVLVDLQKPLDTIDIAYKWFSSYLSFHQQFVSIGKTNSNYLPIRHGVPQGSVLGPLLILLYINELHLSLKHSEATYFANDTNLASS